MKFDSYVDAGSPASRRSVSRGRALGAGVVLLLLAVSGCGGSDDDQSDQPPEVSDFPVVTQDAALPLDAYTLSTGEQAELKDLYRELLTRCARGFGGEPVVVAPGTEEVVKNSRIWGGRFGTLSLEHASSLGYHAGPHDPVAPSFGLFGNEGEEPLATILYGADREVIGDDDGSTRPDIAGLPDGGCVGQVDSELGGDPLGTTPDAIDKMRLTAFRDDRTQSAVRAWSTCMADAGYTYESVDGPIDEFADGRPLSEEEVSVAVADVGCTKASRWRDISFAIEKAYQERELKENPERWADVKANAETIYENARTMVAGNSR